MPLKAPFQSPDLTMHYILQPLIHAVLGSSIALDTLSTVTTPPTAPTQLFRRDADFLFAASEDAAPAHALVVELPLADLPPGMEGTSFLAGSQLGCDARAAVADARVDAASILCPAGLAAALVETTPSVGNVLLYDARVLRRQHANNSPFRHASFFLRYVRDWFFDATRTQEHVRTVPNNQLRPRSASSPSDAGRQHPPSSPITFVFLLPSLSLSSFLLLLLHLLLLIISCFLASLPPSLLASSFFSLRLVRSNTRQRSRPWTTSRGASSSDSTSRTTSATSRWNAASARASRASCTLRGFPRRRLGARDEWTWSSTRA